MIPNMEGRGDPTKPVVRDPIDHTFPTLINGRIARNEADAYWASQPPEVQALYFLHTEGERDELAHQLADKGFLIDVPIMIWGWDPLSTMIVRKNMGYKWIPSAKMAPPSAAPGINSGGFKGPDESFIPPGGIPVTTMWARGFEKTSPWLQSEYPDGAPLF